MLHTALIGQHGMLKHPGVFEVLGFDFLLDTSLKTWFIEVTGNAGFGSSAEKSKVQTKIWEGLVNLESALVA